MTAYYNENDPFAAQWLRNLIAAGHLPQGDVDERSIVDVRAPDLAGYRQCHFFAGIGGWPHALRLAGWPDDREVWTGSCPCQPLSSAGQRRGHADERHLWPAFHALIAECRPATVFGEQVASKDGREWLAGVRADLERAGYACGSADLCAAGAGAPHIRQRLFWVANTDRGNAAQERSGDIARGEQSEGRWSAQPARAGTGSGTGSGHLAQGVGGLADAGRASDERGVRPSQAYGADAAAEGKTQQRQWRGADAGSGIATGGLADAEHTLRGPLDEPRQDGRDGANAGREEAHGEPGACSEVRGLADAQRHAGNQGRIGERSADGATAQGAGSHAESGRRCNAGGLGNFWSDAQWLPCLDGKARRTQPGVFPLAHGVSARVGRLRAYGNAIIPQVAAEFIRALLECT